jgi:hypothetical protein
MMHPPSIYKKTPKIQYRCLQGEAWFDSHIPRRPFPINLSRLDTCGRLPKLDRVNCRRITRFKLLRNTLNSASCLRENMVSSNWSVATFTSLTSVLYTWVPGSH